jgi:hypothetical protein
MPRIRNETFIFFLIPAILVLSRLAGAVETEVIIVAQADNTNEVQPHQSDVPATPDTLIVSTHNIPDTVPTDSVILEPLPYTLGTDPLLIEAYLPRDTILTERPQASLRLLNSVLFPGGGQYSNGAYVKAGVVFVIESYCIYQALHYGRLASESRQRWKAPLATNSPPSPIVPASIISPAVIDTAGLKSEYFDDYTSKRDTRNSYIAYTALTVFLSMFDAYVDAHLKGFPGSAEGQDRLSLDVTPGTEPRFSLRYSF